MPSKPALLSRREQILNALVAVFQGVSVGGDHTFKWDLVTREPMSARELEHDHVLGVWDTAESKHDKISNVEQCTLTVTLGAQSVVPPDLDLNDDLLWTAAEWGNEVLLELQLTLGQADPNLGGLCITFGEVANEVDLEGYDDKRVSVVIMLHVLYRHRLGDPRYAV